MDLGPRFQSLSGSLPIAAVAEQDCSAQTGTPTPHDVLHLQYNFKMKTATIPPIRVAPEFRIEVEGVLEQGESLSEFVENAVRHTVLKRKHQAEFLRRGIAAIEETKRAGGGIAAEAVVAELETKLAAARRTQSQKN